MQFRSSFPQNLCNGLLRMQQGSRIRPSSSHPFSMHDLETPYVDGKLRAWSTVAGAWLICFCGSGMVSAFGVFQAFYATQWLTHTSASAISWIGSVQLALMLLLGPIAGHLLSGGRVRFLLLAACGLNVFSLFMVSLVQREKYYQALLSQGFGMGIGVGLFYMPCLAVVGRHFRRRRALAMGIVASSVSIGGALFSIMFNLFFHGRVGFAWGVRIGAFIVLGLYTAGILLFFEPRAPRTNSPGASAEGNDVAEEKAETSHAATVSTTPVTVSSPPALLDTQYLLVILGGWLVSMGDYVPAFYVQLFIQLHGGNATLAFYSIAILNVSAALGRIIPNILADRFGILSVIFPVWLLNGALAFAMLGATNTTGIILFSIFYGFFFGAGVSLYLPLVASMSIKRGVDMSKRMGIATVPLGLSCLIGPPITGKIVGPNFVWWKGMTFAAVIMVASVIPIGVVWMMNAGERRRNTSVQPVPVPLQPVEMAHESK